MDDFDKIMLVIVGVLLSFLILLFVFSYLGWFASPVDAIAIIQNPEDWATTKTLVEKYGDDAVIDAARVAQYQIEKTRP